LPSVATAQRLAEARAEAEYLNRNVDLVTRRAQEEARLSQVKRQAIEREEAAAATAARAEADYANRDIDLVAQKARAEAEYQNASMNAAAAKSRAEAQYENATRDAVVQKARAEAEYINGGMDAAAAKARAEAEYENASRDAIANKARAEAEYENASRTAASNKARAEAEYINRDRALKDAALRREAEAENAAFDRRIKASAAQAAATAAARTTVAGGTSAEAAAAAQAAGAAALERQALAAKAAQSALTAARAAGVSEGEAVAISARAATVALEGQALAGNAAGGIVSRLGAIFQREMRHVVGFFDSIARGQRGQAISSLGAAARDAGLGVSGLAVSMGALVAFMAGHAIFHGAEAMGKMATELRAGAAAAGMSIPQYSGLQNSLGLLGLKGEEADATMRHLSTTISTALEDPTSKAAESLHNLGISQEAIIKNGGDVMGMLRLLAQALKEDEQGATTNANLTEALGKGYEKLLPLLQGGVDGFEALIQKGKDLGVVSESDVTSLQQTGEAAEKLSIKLKIEGVQAFVAWGDAIQSAIGQLTSLIGWISSAVNAVGQLNSALHGMLSFGPTAPFTAVWGALTDIYHGVTSTGPYAPGAKPGGRGGMDRHDDAAAARPVPPLRAAGEKVTPIEQMRLDAAQAAEAAEAKEKNARAARIAGTQAEIATIKAALASGVFDAKEYSKEKIQVETELANKEKQLHMEQISGQKSGLAEAKAIARQSYEEFAGAEKLKITEAQGSISKIIAIYNEWLEGIRGVYKKGLELRRQFVQEEEKIEREKLRTILEARLKAITEGAQAEEEVNRATKVMGEAQRIGAGTAKRDAGPELEAAAQQVEAAMQKEVAALTEVMNAAEAGSDVQKAAAKEILKVVTQAKQEEINLYNQAAAAAKKSVQEITKIFDGIGSAIESSVNDIFKAIVSPTTTVYKIGLTSVTENDRSQQIKAAIGKMFTSIAEAMLKGIGDLASKLVGQVLAKAIGVTGEAASSGIGGVLGAGVGKLFGQAAPEAAKFGLGAGSNAASSAALTSAGTVLNTAGATLSTAGAALNTAAAALTTASSTSAIGGAAGGAAAATASATATATPIVAAITASSTAIVGAIGTGDASIVTALGAIALKPSFAGFSLAGGGIIPSAAGGMMVGGVTGRGTLSILHPQEMVLPAPISRGLQDMIGRGNVNTANMTYSPTINTASRSRGGTGMSRGEFQQMMAAHGSGMLGEARNMMRNGWRPV
jgi:hypothetical protein